jgi:hypothetical protein
MISATSRNRACVAGARNRVVLDTASRDSLEAAANSPGATSAWVQAVGTPESVVIVREPAKPVNGFLEMLTPERAPSLDRRGRSAPLPQPWRPKCEVRTGDSIKREDWFR